MTEREEIEAAINKIMVNEDGKLKSIIFIKGATPGIVEERANLVMQKASYEPLGPIITMKDSYPSSMYFGITLVFKQH